MDDGIYYMPDRRRRRQHDPAVPELCITQDKEIAPIKDASMGLAVSPDRKTILFSTYARTGSNIMVVDNFQ